MSGRFDDRWLCERLVFPDSRAGADAVLALYKDKTLVESASPVEILYAIVPDTLAATRADTALERNLQTMFGLRLDQVAGYHHEEVLGRVRTCWSFNHSWTLGSWAAHLVSRPASRTIVVHLDAHDDLASPMIGVTDVKGTFTAPIGDSILDLSDASTIEEFVMRGFVGIGSFITPVLHSVSGLEIVHVAREHGAVPEEFELLIERVPETMFTGRELQRPSVRLALPSGNPQFRYTRTSDVGLALQRAVGRDMVLDIDLDYFCNDFDNKRTTSSAFSEQASGAEARGLMEDLEDQLEASRVVPSLVTVAVSPGFFPSNHWETSIPRLKGIISAL